MKIEILTSTGKWTEVKIIMLGKTSQRQILHVSNLHNLNLILCVCVYARARAHACTCICIHDTYPMKVEERLWNLKG